MITWYGNTDNKMYSIIAPVGDHDLVLTYTSPFRDGKERRFTTLFSSYTIPNSDIEASPDCVEFKCHLLDRFSPMTFAGVAKFARVRNGLVMTSGSVLVPKEYWIWLRRYFYQAGETTLVSKIDADLTTIADIPL